MTRRLFLILYCLLIGNFVVASIIGNDGLALHFFGFICAAIACPFILSAHRDRIIYFFFSGCAKWGDKL